MTELDNAAARDERPYGPPRVSYPSDCDWDGRSWTGHDTDRPAAIAEADRTQRVSAAAAAGDAGGVGRRPGAGETDGALRGAAGIAGSKPDTGHNGNHTNAPNHANTANPTVVADPGHHRPHKHPDRRPDPRPDPDPGQGGDHDSSPAANRDPDRTQVVPGRRSHPAPAKDSVDDCRGRGAGPDADRTQVVATGNAPASHRSRPGAGSAARGAASAGPADARDVTPAHEPGRTGGGAPAPPAAGPARAPTTSSTWPAVGPSRHDNGDGGGGGGLRGSGDDEDSGWATGPSGSESAAAPQPRPDHLPRPDTPAPGGRDGPGEQDSAGPAPESAGAAGLVRVGDEAALGVSGRLGPDTVTGSLVGAARQAWPSIGDEVLGEVVAAGETAHVRALADPRGPVAATASAAGIARTEGAAEAALAVSRLGERHAPGEASWAAGGVVIPVLGASGGVGASVTAAAVFDALDACGVPTLLVDAADPARSGLASATSTQPAPARTLHPRIGVGYACRGEQGWVAQMATAPTEVVSPQMVPAPSWWLPAKTAPAVTVVDLGWDPWTAAAAPLRGVGAWLEAGRPSSPRPLLVVEPTRPSLLRANELLTRLRPWITAGQVAAPAGLVVTGARRWPRAVTGVAAQALGELLEHAVFLPHDRDVAVSGIGPGPVSDRLRAAAAAIPAGWGLIPDTGTRTTAGPGRQHARAGPGGAATPPPTRPPKRSSPALSGLSRLFSRGR